MSLFELWIIVSIIFYILTSIGFYQSANFNFKYGDWQKWIATVIWPIAVGLEFTRKGLDETLNYVINYLENLNLK